MQEPSENSRSAVRARRGAGQGAGRCVELDPALMTVTLTRGAGHYTEEGNTIKVGALGVRRLQIHGEYLIDILHLQQPFRKIKFILDSGI